jgi:hypothetical protein
MNYTINFNNFKISTSHKKKVLQFIDELVNSYSLKGSYFTLNFENILYFGKCFPSLNFSSSSIIINRDLLKQELSEELKGCLAHEFAHFYHYVNFSKLDCLKFVYRIGGHVYSRKFTKDKIILFEKYNTYYEQITDLTACQFGYKKELTHLKKFVPIYRKNLSSYKVPNSSHYLSYDFLKNLTKDGILFEAEKRKKLLGFKSLRYN